MSNPLTRLAPLLGDLGLDVRFAFRTLRRAPGFTLVALFTLALGIGGTTAMFSVLDRAVRRSLPFRDADQLVLGRATFSGRLNPWVAFPDYMDFRDQATSLQSLAAVSIGANLVTITGRGEPEQARLTFVTGNLFGTLGVVPALGGSFTIDELPQEGGEVVISHGFWQHWFGGSRDVLGRTLVVSGAPLIVVGVMPAGFRFMFDADLWVPPWPGNSNPVTRRYHNWLLVGRLQPGVSLQTAQSEVDVISRQLEAAYPESNQNKALQLDGLHTAMLENYRQSLFILMGAVSLVLLIACGNVASLLMARASTRTSELAVRVALGARRYRLARQLLVECVVLALAAGAIGTLLAVWLQKLILGYVAMDLLGIQAGGISGTMLAIALILSLATVLLFGLVPSLTAARADPAADLKEGRRAASTRGGVRLRSGLVVAQVALSVVLLVGAGLLLKSFARLRGVDPGFRVERLLTATVDLPMDRYGAAERRVQFFESLKASVEALPGVEAVGLVSRLPILQAAGNVAIWDPDHPPESNTRAPWADRRVILPGYFATMDIPLLEGRALEGTDVAEAPPVIVLSRTTAQRVFPEGRALGRRVAVDMGQDEPGLFEVVGVVEDHQTSSLAGAARPVMYFAYAQMPAGTMRLAVATSGEPGRLTRAIEERLWALDRDIVLSDTQTMEDAIAGSIAGARSVTLVLGMFAGVAVALAALGVYGVLAFFVARRTHEIGIRVALGATGGQILGLVVGRGMLLVAGGLALGIVAARVAGRLVEGMLFQTGSGDVVTFVGVAGCFLLVALGSCLLPAWKALRVNPVDAFRAE